MPEEQNPAGRDIEFPDWYQVIQNVRNGALLYVNPCYNGTNGSINNPLVPWWLLICLMLCQSKISDLILGDIYFELTLHLWGEILIISNAILHGFFFQWEEQDGFLNGDKAWQWFLEFNKWRFSKAKCSIRYSAKAAVQNSALISHDLIEWKNRLEELLLLFMSQSKFGLLEVVLYDHALSIQDYKEIDQISSDR